MAMTCPILYIMEAKLFEFTSACYSELLHYDITKICVLFPYASLMVCMHSVSDHVTCLNCTGWLREPEARPPFSELVTRLDEFLQDPLRYILTTTDGLVVNYDNLPTNISKTGESTYENPFLVSMSSAVSNESPPTPHTPTVAPVENGLNPYLNSDVFVGSGGGQDYSNIAADPKLQSQSATFSEVRLYLSSIRSVLYTRTALVLR